MRCTADLRVEMPPEQGDGHMALRPRSHPCRRGTPRTPALQGEWEARGPGGSPEGPWGSHSMGARRGCPAVMTRTAVGQAVALRDVAEFRDEQSQEGASRAQSPHGRSWEMSRRAPRHGKGHAGGERSQERHSWSWDQGYMAERRGARSQPSREPIMFLNNVLF